jgi:serine/threonine protein kinase
VTLSPGSRIGTYEVVAPLGAGGMGEVYRARDTRLGRDVAIKVMPRQVADDPERRDRFEREARTVAALNHPNIVTLHSIEEDRGVLFQTMELVEGRTLSACVPRRGLPVDELLHLAIPLVDAVAAAHQRGVTHRYLKPANVMVTPDGRVKVLDFGLAKVLPDSPLGDPTMVTAAHLTREGRILGTLAYMSPEQAQGKPVDTRSDIFSLGILLYEMATGERPFKGDGVSVLTAILRDSPASVTDVRADLPRDVSRILKRCLAKDPEDRYQTAKDLRSDLRLLQQDIDSGAPRSAETGTVTVTATAAAARRPSTRRAVVASLAAVIVAAAAAGWWWQRPSPRLRCAG